MGLANNLTDLSHPAFLLPKLYTKLDIPKSHLCSELRKRRIRRIFSRKGAGKKEERYNFLEKGTEKNESCGEREAVKSVF